MSNAHSTRTGHNYFKVNQAEHVPSWGQTNGSILRTVEFEDGGDGQTFAMTMYTDHKGQQATPLTLSMTLRLPVEYLAEIIDTLSGIRAQAEQQRQAKAWWEMKQRMPEADPLMKLADEDDLERFHAAMDAAGLDDEGR